MEKIAIRVLHCEGVPTQDEHSAVFGMAGGTIGRGGQNKLILSRKDDNSVARVHAMVRLDHECAYIANLSESKSIWVGDEDVQSGREVPLALGTNIRIGPYTLCAVAANPQSTSFGSTALGSAASSAATSAPRFLEPSGMKSVPTIPAPAALSKMSAVQHSSESNANPWAVSGMESDTRTGEFGNVGAARTASQPFGLLGAALPVDSAIAAVFSDTLGKSHPSEVVDQRAHLKPLPSPHRPLIPDDFDPFTPPQQPQDLDGWSGAGLSLRDLVAPSPTVVNDDLVAGLPLHGKLDDALDDPSHSGLPKRYEVPQTLDPLALFNEQSIGVESHELARQTAPGSELAQVFQLPRNKATDATTFTSALPVESVEPITSAEAPSLPASLDLSAPLPTRRPATEPHQATPQPSVTPTQAPPPFEKPAASPKHAAAPAYEKTDPAQPGMDNLAEAFMRGAGLDSSRSRLLITPEFMQTFGEVLRVAVQGTIDLLAARAEIKREFRAGVTIISSGANNPLKFLPSAEGVLLQMTNQSFPGFMEPLPAMEEAYMDLRVHQIAVMAGIRAAYSEALTRFDPTELEFRAEPNLGLLDRLMASVRKAALWDEYKHSFHTLRQHAEDDLMAFSGKTFVDAYEQAAYTPEGGKGPSK